VKLIGIFGKNFRDLLKRAFPTIEDFSKKIYILITIDKKLQDFSDQNKFKYDSKHLINDIIKSNRRLARSKISEEITKASFFL